MALTSRQPNPVVKATLAQGFVVQLRTPLQPSPSCHVFRHWTRRCKLVVGILTVQRGNALQ